MERMSGVRIDDVDQTSFDDCRKTYIMEKIIVKFKPLPNWIVVKKVLTSTSMREVSF